MQEVGVADVPETSECGPGVSQQGDPPERPGEETPGTPRSLGPGCSWKLEPYKRSPDAS